MKKTISKITAFAIVAIFTLAFAISGTNEANAQSQSSCYQRLGYCGFSGMVWRCDSDAPAAGGACLRYTCKYCDQGLG
jgi:hypothetical protein